MNRKEKYYSSPALKEIKVNAGHVLCESSSTEKFVVSDNNYDEDNWE